MLDFNDVPIGGARKVAEGSTDTAREKDEIRSALNEQLTLLVLDIWPSGKRRQNKYLVGDVMGGPGDSLELLLSGTKAGLWTDRATGEGGDILDLIARYYSLDVQAQFPQVLERAKGWLGRVSAMPASSVAASKAKAPAVDELGPATAKWDYQDASGKLIAVVYRYDPEPGRKEFRPWDVRRRKMAPPEPRPLYNQSGMLKSEQVVMVEGEKCAQALIDLGVCATTAMHGANAPVEKTDWSPLSGKHVLIWPDRDKPGWQYADHASQAIMQAGAKSCVILQPPAEKPEGWDVADAVQDGFDITGFLAVGERVPVVHQIDVHAPMQLVDGIDYTNEDGLAMAFSHQFSEDWRYCAPWSKWLVWNGVRWNIDKALYVMHLCRLICRAASVQADGTKLKGRLASSGTISAIERIVRSEPRHSATVEEWDSSVWLLNTPGGIVDLRSGARGPHARDRRMTKVTTATPQGDCPVWRNFLVNVTGGDEELQDYLQRVVGYCLTGDISTHALFFLYGTGANGKSVFVNVISTVLGDYAANAPMDTFMESRSDRHPTDLAGLRGARFVSATETEQGRRWNESKIKAITGGDDITARLMHQDFFTYRPQFKLLIAGNHKPAIRNIDEAMRLAAVYACVRILSETMASLPLVVYRPRKDGGKDRVTDHWLYQLLGKRPNRYQNPFEWREMLQGHLALRGNAFCQILANSRGEITELIPIHPDRVRMELMSSGDYRYRIRDQAGSEIVLPRGEIWHLRGLSSDGLIGLSPIELSRESLGMALAAQDYGARFFSNDAKPTGGWIEFPGTFKDPEAKRVFRESYQAAQSGSNRGKVLVLENGMKFHEVGVTNKDAQFLELRKFQITDIARLFRVPPHMIADLDRATFSNIEQQSLEFVMHTMTPWAERWEASIEADLLPDGDALEIEFDFANLMRGDAASRSAYYQSGIQNGWLTRNEARISENLNPIAGLHQPLRPLNMVEEDDAEDAEIESQDSDTDASPEPDQQLSLRLRKLVESNAQRLARRICKKGALGSNEINLIAQTFSLPSSAVEDWAQGAPSLEDEPALSRSLIQLGIHT